MYHDFSHLENTPLSISPQRFEEHLKKLREHSFNVISMEQFIDFMLYDKQVPTNAVLITFDDGYEDFYTIAYPILKKYAMVASNFVIVRATDVPNPNALPHLTWIEMREMKQNGMGFYSHTYNHHYFLGNDNTKPALITSQQDEDIEQYFKRVKNDFIIAQDRLDEELGKQPKIIAFPYGAYNETVTKIGKELGIAMYFTTKEGFNISKTNEVNRINAGRKDMSANQLIEVLKKQSY